tara:strand:- start:991 stop:1566 length:576 start_codon:yes stop_codon:yes gene_type:complete
MSRPPRDSDNLSDDDLALWARVAETVTRSWQDRKRKYHQPDAPHTPQTSKDKPEQPVPKPGADPRPMVPARQRPAHHHDMHGRTMDRRTEQKLRQGKLRIDETIDLHGLSQEAAHNLLKVRLVAAQKRGKRVILVITGKGLRSAAPGGILRQSLSVWCELPPLSSIILKRVKAQPRDGGSGAFYIYLRRKR